MDKYATLRLPKEVHSEVKILAVTSGMTMTDYIAFLVKQEKAKKESAK